MEKIVIKIGRFIETATASMLMLFGFQVAQHFPFIGFAFFIGGILLWNEIIREGKGGAR